MVEADHPRPVWAGELSSAVVWLLSLCLSSLLLAGVIIHVTISLVVFTIACEYCMCSSSTLI